MSVKHACGDATQELELRRVGCTWDGKRAKGWYGIQQHLAVGKKSTEEPGRV